MRFRNTITGLFRTQRDAEKHADTSVAESTEKDDRIAALVQANDDLVKELEHANTQLRLEQAKVARRDSRLKMQKDRIKELVDDRPAR